MLTLNITAFGGLVTLAFMAEPKGKIAEVNEDGSVTLIDVGSH